MLHRSWRKLRNKCKSHRRSVCVSCGFLGVTDHREIAGKCRVKPLRAESYFFWVLLETIVSHNATWNRLYYLLFDSGFMYKRQSRRFRAISHFSRESGLRTLRSLLWIHRNLFNMFLVSPLLGTLLILLVLYFHADEKFHEYAIRPFHSYPLFSQSGHVWLGTQMRWCPMAVMEIPPCPGRQGIVPRRGLVTKSEDVTDEEYASFHTSLTIENTICL